MAKRTASAKKQARAGVRRAARNRAVRSEVKTMVVKARRSLDSSGSGGDVAPALDALRALDRAAAKGILHPNNAARRKARLARRLAKVSSAAPSATSGTSGTSASAGAAKGKRGAAAAPSTATATDKKK